MSASAAAGAVAPVADSGALPPRGEAQPGKLISAPGWDGHAFLGLGDDLRLHAGLLGGHTSALGGMQARLALAASYRDEPPGTNPYAYRPSPNRIGIDELWLRYPFAMVSWPAAVQGGAFRWRFDPDACLSGEYLPRLGAYPPIPIRPGLPWEALDSLSTRVTGLRLGLASPGKTFSSEVLALYDREDEDHRLSLLFAGNLQPARGVEIGAALEILSVASTREPQVLLAPIRSEDTTMNFMRMDEQVVLSSARLALDIVALITGPARPDRGGRLFAEAALLGWRDYPFYYEDRSARLHLLAGLHLPAFGLLDALRIQAERVPMAGDNRGPWVGTWLPQAGPAFEPPTHVWYGQAYLSRTVLPWADAQAWARLELGEEGGRGDPPYNDVRNRMFQAGLRLSGRL